MSFLTPINQKNTYQLSPCLQDSSHGKKFLVRDGIRFFNNRFDCIADFKNAHWTRKTRSCIQSFGTLLIHFLNRMSLVVRRVETQMSVFAKISNQNLSEQNKLVVCIHGLNRNLSQFERLVDEMQKRGLAGTAIFIPCVLQKGNAKLSEMAKPIVEKIAAWAKIPGDKELVLLATSNGERISLKVEAELIKLKKMKHIKKVRRLSIVGAKASPLVDLANKLGLSWFLSKHISKEMATDSKCGIQLNKDWKEGLKNSPKIVRDFTFIASPHDVQVNYDSSLPEVDSKKACYALVAGHGHNSIVNRVAKVAAEIVLS